MRLLSIDILRTFAVCLMILVHFTENLSGYDWILGGFGAPLFTFLSGVSYRLWLTRQEAQGVSDDTISKRTIRRGLFLFGLGIAFNILVWLPEDTFNWDVLTLIGTGYLLLDWARRVPLVLPLFVAVLVFALSPYLRVLADTPAYWTQGRFECDLTLRDVLLGYLVNGYFPLFPWILYPLVGYVVGSVLFSRPTPPRGALLRLGLLGAALIVVSVLATTFRPYAPERITRVVLIGWSMFPPSPEYVARTLGIALLAFALLHRWLDPWATARKPRWLERLVTPLSKHSLSIYLLHHVVHLWPLWVYGAYQGQEPTYYWRQAVNVGLAFFLGSLCIVGCYLCCLWLDWSRRKGVEGWMRWVCD